MTTIKDVAKEAGVSIATVSRVINNSPQAAKKSIESVQAAMQKLGYRPNANARALVSKNTNTIGVVVGDISDPFFGELLKSIDKVARKNNKHLLIGNGFHNAEEERRAIELLINSCSESLIIHSKALCDQALINYSKEVPGLVLINRYIPEIAERCITFDNQKGAYLATKFLIRNRHKHIAYINSDTNIEDANARKAGYLQALKEHQLPYSELYTVTETPNDEGGKAGMFRLLQQNRDITAVFAYNDYMAAGALSALQEKQIAVPHSISLVGFDNALIADYLYPKLTTVHYPIDLMAEQAALLSLRLIKKEVGPAETKHFQPTLIERNSVSRLA